VRGLAIDPSTPSTLYAATSSGVFKTVDGGDAWAPVNQGLTNLDVASVVVDSVDPSTVFAGTRGNSAFVSRDGGMTWQ